MYGRESFKPSGGDAIELSDNNIVVNYKNEGTLRFKLANNLAEG